jgi:hypothetical protein
MSVRARVCTGARCTITMRSREVICWSLPVGMKNAREYGIRSSKSRFSLPHILLKEGGRQLGSLMLAKDMEKDEALGILAQTCS